MLCDKLPSGEDLSCKHLRIHIDKLYFAIGAAYRRAKRKCLQISLRGSRFGTRLGTRRR